MRSKHNYNQREYLYLSSHGSGLQGPGLNFFYFMTSAEIWPCNPQAIDVGVMAMSSQGLLFLFYYCMMSAVSSGLKACAVPVHNKPLKSFYPVCH